MDKNIKILIIGDMCKDVYIYGDCNRLCPDAPVPVFLPKNQVISSGMSGNVFNNISIFDVGVDIITNKRHVIKTRYVDNKTNQMLIRIDEGEDVVDRIENLEDINLAGYDAILVSDYDKGFLYEDDIKYICENHNKVFIDTKKRIDEYCKDAFIIKINDLEYSLSKRIIEKMDIEDSLIVTLGSKGATYKGMVYPVEKVDIKDQTGAGDTFISALLVKYLDGNDIHESITFANKCATYVVQKRGVVATTAFPLDFE